MYAGSTSLGVHELKIKNYIEKKVILCCVILNSEAEALRKAQSKKNKNKNKNASLHLP